MLNKKHAEAENCFRETSAIAEQFNESTIGIAISLYESKKYREALDTLNSINSELYKDAKLPFWQAMSHRMLQNYDMAKQYFTKCISYGSGEISIDAYRYRGLTNINKILLTQYPRTSKKGKPFPFSIDEIGDNEKIEKIKQHLKNSEKDFSTYAALKKNNSGVCFEHALVEYLLGEKESSLHMFETCIDKNVNSQASYYMIGIILQDNSKHTEAIVFFTKSIALNKKHSKSLYHRALSYAEINEKKLAIEDLKAAIKINTNKLYIDVLIKLQQGA